MTFAILRRLHAIIGNSLDEIECVYKSHGYSAPSGSAGCRKAPDSSLDQSVPSPFDKASQSTLFSAYVSPPPSPSIATCSDSIAANLDFPSLDAPCNPTSLSEVLTSDPTVLSAIGQIIAAAGQLTATVQTPFLTLCDAIMGYHLPSCMRLLEASHVVEILREAGPGGLHVDTISEKNGVDSKKLAHILRLLATHHILREVSPDIFTLNRISSLVDSGKSFSELQRNSCMKYGDTNGIAAFVGLCTDELQKSAAYMTETYYLSPSKQTRAGTDPARAPFCFAFDTVKNKTGFFGWLEGEIHETINRHDDHGIETGPGSIPLSVLGRQSDPKRQVQPPSTPGRGVATFHRTPRNGKASEDRQLENPNKFRLERFGKAMTGTDGWEAPGAILNGFDWRSLLPQSVVVDVGGGIGSTSMLLATAFSAASSGDEGRLKFIIQDRAVVCEMGEKAWKAKCPELLETTAKFQAHDFFKPQPVRNAALFILRVVLHDWPDAFARKILRHLREAATPTTKLLIADFVLPLACPESMTGLEDVEGAQGPLPPEPLLPNLGKASANVYWMDMTMQVTFNSQERTLREMVTLAASAGWKVTKVTRTPGSLFGYIVAVPMPIPDVQTSNGNLSILQESGSSASLLSSWIKDDICEEESPGMEHEQQIDRSDLEVIERASSRCGTPTFGSNLRLSSVQEALAKFGGGIVRRSRLAKIALGSSSSAYKEPPPIPLKPALTLISGGGGAKKKGKPSSLSVVTSQGSPTGPGPSLHTPLSATTPTAPGKKLLATSPKQESSRAYAGGQTPSHSPLQQGQVQPHSPAPPPKKAVPRRLSLANLRPTASQSQPVPPLPTFTFTHQPAGSPRSPKDYTVPVSVSPMRRRGSHAQLPFAETTGAGVTTHADTQQTSQVNVQGFLAPSFIPVRTSTSQGGIANSGSLAFPSPSPTQRLIPRRSSFVQLSQPPLRTRSGTVAGTSSRPFFGTLTSQQTQGQDRNDQLHLRPLSRSPADEQQIDYVPEFGSGSVLATAAKFEKGKFCVDEY